LLAGLLYIETTKVKVLRAIFCIKLRKDRMNMQSRDTLPGIPMHGDTLRTINDSVIELGQRPAKPPDT